MSDNGEVRGSHQTYESSVKNLLHVTLLAPRIWRWLLDIWKVCGLLFLIHLTL